MLLLFQDLKRNLKGWQKSTFHLKMSSRPCWKHWRRSRNREQLLVITVIIIMLAIASKGKGKRGGGRVITNFVITENTVYLLSIYDKSEKETLSDKELTELLKFVPS